MPGLDPKVAVPKLKIKEDATPVKQAPRRMRVELEEQVTAETRKLIDAGKRKMLAIQIKRYNFCLTL